MQLCCTVLIEAALLEPSPERARRPQKLVQRLVPRPRSYAAVQNMPAFSFSNRNAIAKATKEWKSSQQFRAVYSIFYFAKNPLIAEFSPFIHREHGYPICLYHHQPSTYLHSSSYADEQSLSPQ